ncbi:MAG: hypothetical protein JNL96_15805 [Planctomycetaceae bacterium]|nr:hypothetical protein [Planctomycetaceae bacterium]
MNPMSVVDARLSLPIVPLVPIGQGVAVVVEVGIASVRIITDKGVGRP